MEKQIEDKLRFAEDQELTALEKTFGHKLLVPFFGFDDSHVTELGACIWWPQNLSQSLSNKPEGNKEDCTRTFNGMWLAFAAIFDYVALSFLSAFALPSKCVDLILTFVATAAKAFAVVKRPFQSEESVPDKDKDQRKFYAKIIHWICFAFSSRKDDKQRNCYSKTCYWICIAFKSCVVCVDYIVVSLLSASAFPSKCIDFASTFVAARVRTFAMAKQPSQSEENVPDKDKDQKKFYAKITNWICFPFSSHLACFSLSFLAAFVFLVNGIVCISTSAATSVRACMMCMYPFQSKDRAPDEAKKEKSNCFLKQFFVFDSIDCSPACLTDKQPSQSAADISPLAYVVTDHVIVYRDACSYQFDRLAFAGELVVPTAPPTDVWDPRAGRMFHMLDIEGGGSLDMNQLRPACQMDLKLNKKLQVILLDPLDDHKACTNQAKGTRRRKRKSTKLYESMVAKSVQQYNDFGSFAALCMVCRIIVCHYQDERSNEQRQIDLKEMLSSLSAVANEKSDSFHDSLDGDGLFDLLGPDVVLPSQLVLTNIEPPEFKFNVALDRCGGMQSTCEQSGFKHGCLIEVFKWLGANVEQTKDGPLWILKDGLPLLARNGFVVVPVPTRSIFRKGRFVVHYNDHFEGITNQGAFNDAAI